MISPAEREAIRKEAERIAAAAPPLSPERAARIAGLLRPAKAAGSTPAAA